MTAFEDFDGNYRKTLERLGAFERSNSWALWKKLKTGNGKWRRFRNRHRKRNFNINYDERGDGTETSSGLIRLRTATGGSTLSSKTI
ncbi:unnamed protein product [Caenorhabditis auriculariae]|uniref:Uncharacterized protein n=1 Tax=Caenorhabditis auriculariae TaxID=2777116 RepID=A0A8S1GZR7_9PELO|nr:unnamed protein product [Caenorhabditis auriculariae]